MKKRMVALLLAFSMMAAVLAGCSGNQNSNQSGTASDTPTPTQGQTSQSAGSQSTGGTEPPADSAAEPYGVFRDYITGDPDTLNPHTYASTTASTMFGKSSMNLYFTTLNDAGDATEFIGELADGDPVQMDSDMKVWQIKIIETAKWQNGDPITIDDVIYSFKMCLDPLLVNTRAGGMAKNYVEIVNANAYATQGSANTVAWEDVGIRKVDEYTMEVELVNPAPVADVKKHFSGDATTLVHEATYEAGMSADRTSTTYGIDLDHYMSCGPWILTEWTLGAQLVFERNPDYVYADKIKMAGYTYRLVADTNTALELFLNDELDYISIPAAARKQYEEDPRSLIYLSSCPVHIAVNMGATNHNGILGNVDFRRALYYAIDRDAIGNIVNGVGATWIIGTKSIADDDTGEGFRELAMAQEYLPENSGYNPELAKEYYDKAMAEAGLTSLSLTIAYTETNVNRKGIAELLQETLPQIFGDSFTLEPLPVPGTVVTENFTKARTGEDVNSYDLQITQRVPGSDPANAIYPYTTAYTNKFEAYSNPELDALYDEVMSSMEYRLDQSLRNEAYCEMEKILIDEVATIPLYEQFSHIMYSDRVQLAATKYIQGFGFGVNYATLLEE